MRKTFDDADYRCVHLKLRKRLQRSEHHQLTITYSSTLAGSIREWNENPAKTSIKIQNSGLRLKTKIVAHPKICKWEKN